MKTPATENALALEVADFGPIVQAKVDLRPLTVFVGPSNTGKSYLAILIYALHRFFGGSLGPVSRFSPGTALRNLSDKQVDALLEVAQSLVPDAEATTAGSISLPPPVAELLRRRFDDAAKDLEREVARCFGLSDLSTIVRKGGRPAAARVSVLRRMPHHTDFSTHTALLGQDTRLETSVPSKTSIPVNDKAHDKLDALSRRLIRWTDRLELSSLADLKTQGARRKFVLMDLLNSISNMVLPGLVGPLHLPAYYLPADRIGIMHAHSVVVSSLIASAPAAGLRPVTRTSVLTGVLADFLEQLIRIDQTRHPRRDNKQDIGKVIEETMLGGSIRINRSIHIDYPNFTYRPRGWKEDLPLANASSMVSGLAPVVLYLRHLISPGNVLIIEEPESHLHPAMQVAFTRQLAALVAAGIRVIVTTHSEWLLEELANIVRRSALAKADQDDEIALRPDQVGAWLFKPKQRPKGSVVEEISLDESGLYPSGFDEVAKTLHNDWADIESRIEGDS